MPDRIPRYRPRTASGRASRAAYERTEQRKADHAFYNSAAWRKCRLAFLADNPLCADCDREGRTVAAVDVHHLRERKDAPDLAFDRENLEALCKSCHARRRYKS